MTPPQLEPSGSPVRPIRVLIVDDEPLVRESIAICLSDFGHEVTQTISSDHARVAVARRRFDMVLLDMRLNDDSGLDLIPELLQADPSLSIVLMTGFGSVESAVEAMRRGAFDYIHKPIAPAELRLLVQRVEERRALGRQVPDRVGQGTVHPRAFGH
jgi:NtrC-family two-component system response regulator AlgB